MVQGVIARLLSATGVLAAGVVLGAGLTPPSAAQAATTVRPVAATSAGAPVAAPKVPPKPTAVQITGKFDGESLTVQQAERPELFQRLLTEVGWLATTEPTTSKPKADKLGPKFTVTVLIKDKPAQVVDKIIEGKLNSYYQQVCLLEQASVRDPNVTIQQLVQDGIRILGENITVTRFVRFKVGEHA